MRSAPLWSEGRIGFFSDTVRGAEASANLYSIIETAKANGLEPYRYLCHLLSELPQATTVEEIERLLPTRWKPAVEHDAALLDPAPRGACCLFCGDECLIVTSIVCEMFSGCYHGDGTLCQPLPCDDPVPTQESSWGEIKARYREPR